MIISHKDVARGYSNKVPNVPGLYWVLSRNGEQEREVVVDVGYDHEFDEMIVWRIGVKSSTSASDFIDMGYLFGHRAEPPATPRT